MLNLTEKIQKDYGEVKRICEKEFPEDFFFITLRLWDDDTYYIEGQHTRKDHICRVIIGNGKWANKIVHAVYYRRPGEEEEEEKQILIWDSGGLPKR